MKRIASQCCLFALILVLAHGAIPGRVIAEESPASFDEVVRPFLKQHCYECHGPERQEAQIRYDDMAGYDVERQHLWTAVHEKLSAGEMPPEDRPQPSDEAKRRILAWIERESAAAQQALGAGSLRRLNRREFSAALQDVTGLSVNYADALPGDGKVNGFDTGAEGLQDAADSVAQMMRITRRAVEGIYFLELPQREPVAIELDLREVNNARDALKPFEEQGFDGKLRGEIDPEQGLYIEPKWVGERGDLEIFVPPPSDRRGVLRVTFTVGVMKPYDSVPNPNFWVEVGAKDIAYEEITASPDEPHEFTYEVQLEDLAIEPKGVQISFSNRVELPYAVEGFKNEDKTKPDENIPGGPGLFRPDYDRKKTPPEKTPAPFVVLRQVKIEADYVAAWPPAEWEAGIGEISDSPEIAEKLLALWMERAWRRPVTDAEQQRFLTLYRELRAQGLGFDDALRATFQSVLMSGPFRYLASPSDADPVVAQHAIASRLSFMLWGAPPDAELRRLAAEGKLRDPGVLDAQVDRLLDDPRSEGFVRPFVEQWLVMDQPITIVMDYFSQQDFRFGRYLKSSMREETIQYVAQLLAENRPAKELIQSDWTMMNESLAHHYGYEGIEGGRLRKVKLRDDDPRGGGILSHAGIQSMLCWMGENWVIYRGAWALRHILDDPPPPPPLEVPELIPSDGKNHGKTFRELLKQHQEDAKCAVCHRKMDPLGFAFQNFDISGRWRDVEFEKYIRNELDGKIEWRGAGKERPVDAAGQLPRGEQFSSFAECQELIVKHYMPDLVRGLLKNLMLYATGRKPGVAEMAEIKAIIAEQSPHKYPLRDLVKAVVRSKAFLGDSQG